MIAHLQVNHAVWEVHKFLLGDWETGAGRCALIHCTHGFNRTGYVVTCALARLLGPAGFTVSACSCMLFVLLDARRLCACASVGRATHCVACMHCGCLDAATPGCCSLLARIASGDQRMSRRYLPPTATIGCYSALYAPTERNVYVIT